MAHSITSIPGVTNFVDKRNSLMTNGNYKTRKLNNIARIIIHHGASAKDATPEQWAKDHVKNRKWPGIGYHFVIERSGKVTWCNNLEAWTNHAGNANESSIDICMVGNFDEHDPSPQQLSACVAVTKYIMNLFKIAPSDVLGHRESNILYYGEEQKSCPGKRFDMDEYRRSLGGSLAGDSSTPLGESSGTGWKMPTYQNYTGSDKALQTSLKNRIKGTDKWNKEILKVSLQEGVNPVFVKVIMASESAGNMTSVSNAGAYGLMQVLKTSDNASKIDWNRIQSDPEYAILQGIKVIKAKVAAAGDNPSIHEVAWRYIGKHKPDHRAYKTEKAYADQVAMMYEKLGFDPEDSVLLTTPKGKYDNNGVYGGGGSAGDDLTSDAAYHISSKLLAVAPDAEDDDFPHHRYAGNPFVLRIGDSQFYLPPDSIKTSKVSDIEVKQILRSKDSIKKKSGYTLHKLTIRLFFHGHEMINGYEVKGPGERIYYMDGLRSLLAQFYKNPFLPIRNELINDRHKIYNVALSDIQIATDPNITELLVVDLTLLECTVEPFITFPDYFYDRLFVYPLWRWWYQQMLSPNETERQTSYYLEPVPKKMNGEVFFRVLSEGQIESLQNNIPEEYRSYALAHYKDDIRRLMEDWHIGDAIATNVMVTVKKELTPLRTDEHEIPAFQDMGGIRKEFIIEFHCPNRECYESLLDLQRHLERLSRTYRNRFVSGFLEIDNEILNMAGIQFGMIIGMETETIPDITNEFKVFMYGESFEGNQKNFERLTGVNGRIGKEFPNFNYTTDAIDTKTNRVHEVLYETKLNYLLQEMELYPDLDLPTYADANAAITEINEFRVARGHAVMPFDSLRQPEGTVWCDPDFYLAYPGVKTMFQDLKIADMGDSVVELLMTSNDLTAIGTEQSLNVNTILDWVMENKIANHKDLSTEELAEYKQIQLSQPTFANSTQTFKVPAGTSWTANVDDTGKLNQNLYGDEEMILPPDEELVGMMGTDMIKYNQHGRMTRAFPTFLLLFVDEGQWYDGKRLFNNYYAYHAVESIDIVKDKNNPVDLAYVRLSNVYGSFDYQARLHDSADIYNDKKTITERVKDLFKYRVIRMEEEYIQKRSIMLEHVKINQGARIHLRLGYSSSASELPIVFNGHVATVSDGEELEIVCQGDGVELINTPYSDDPANKTPGEPWETFAEILCKRSSNYLFTATPLNFMDNFESYYGIEHFGFVEAEPDDGSDKQSWGPFAKKTLEYIMDWGRGATRNMNVYDVMKNVYHGVEKANTTAQNEWWTSDTIFDGAHNITLNGYNRPPWDIMNTIALFVPDFICGIHPHGFRSTVFFGMPHWLVKYGYVENGEIGTGKTYQDFSEMVKPFQQFHTLSTGFDIIHNNIQASSEHIYHVVVPAYMRGRGQNEVTSYAQYADRTIHKSYQKTKILDTGVFQNVFGFDFAWELTGKLAGDIGNLPTDIVEAGADILSWAGKKLGIDTSRIESEREQILNSFVYSYLRQYDKDRTFSPGAIQAREVAVGALERSFMEMYQGELIIFGNPSIKPWDIFHLNDIHRGMSGTAQVGKVTHSLSKQTGFTTVIKPDLCVARADSLSRNAIFQMLIKLGVASGLVTTRLLMSTYLAKQVATRTGALLERPVTKGRTWLFSKSGKVATTFQWLVGTGDEITDATKKVINSVKTGTTMSKMTVLGLITAGVSAYIEDFFRKNFAYNSMIYIFPLWKYNRPFTAGIKGAKFIIPNYVDPEVAAAEGISGEVTGNETGAESVDDASSEYSASIGDTDGDGKTSKKEFDKANWWQKVLAATSSFSPLIFVPKASAAELTPAEQAMLSGKSGKNGKIYHPLMMHTKITDSFGTRGGKHAGVDLASLAAIGKGSLYKTPIYAVADGKVIVSKFSDTAGNYVAILHKIDGKDVVTTYMHMKHGSVRVKKGDIVKGGDPIGIMGNTGNVRGVTGIHLHFEVAIGVKTHNKGTKNKVDPIRWLQSYGVKIR